MFMSVCNSLAPGFVSQQSQYNMLETLHLPLMFFIILAELLQLWDKKQARSISVSHQDVHGFRQVSSNQKHPDIQPILL